MEWRWALATRGVEVGQRWAIPPTTPNPFLRERGPVCVVDVTDVRKGWVRYAFLSGGTDEMDGELFRRVYRRIDR